ncbi:MAG: hypothetical protein JSR58_05895 [Verrucomicrobia bacterium]|nr:hypothetical protein [Verrucomicrobiota bacterium]
MTNITTVATYEKLSMDEAVVVSQGSNSYGSNTPPPSESDNKVETIIVVQELKKPKDKKKDEEVSYPFWCLLGDDDDEEEAGFKKVEKKFERIGPRQVAFLAGAYGATGALSLFFFRAPTTGSSTTPAIIQEFAGASIDMAKKGILFIPSDQHIRKIARGVVYVGLPTIYLVSQYALPKAGVASEMARSIPWIYPTIGVLRTDFSEYANLKHLAKHFNKYDGNKKKIDAADAGWKIATSAVTMAVAPWGAVKAASSVVFKGEFRRWVDIAEEQILPLEGARRKVALVALFGTLSAMSIGGGVNMAFGTERYLDVILLTPPIDTLIRTPKAQLKGWLKKQAKNKAENDGSLTYYAKEGGKIAGTAILLTALGAIAAQAAKGNASFATTLMVDLISIVKVLSKQISPYAMITIATLYMLAAGGVYAAAEFGGLEVNAEVYQTLMTIAALMYATAMYQVRKQIVPEKKAKAPKVEKTEETKGSESMETEASTKPKKDKKDKKEKKDKKVKEAQALENRKAEKPETEDSEPRIVEIFDDNKTEIDSLKQNT